MDQSVIESEKYAMKLCQALGLDFTKVHRIVVDCQAAEPLHVYAEMFGSPRILDVNLPSQEDISLYILEA